MKFILYLRKNNCFIKLIIFQNIFIISKEVYEGNFVCTCTIFIFLPLIIFSNTQIDNFQFEQVGLCLNPFRIDLVLIPRGFYECHTQHSALDMIEKCVDLWDECFGLIRILLFFIFVSNARTTYIARHCCEIFITCIEKNIIRFENFNSILKIIDFIN